MQHGARSLTVAIVLSAALGVVAQADPPLTTDQARRQASAATGFDFATDTKMGLSDDGEEVLELTGTSEKGQPVGCVADPQTGQVLSFTMDLGESPGGRQPASEEDSKALAADTVAQVYGRLPSELGWTVLQASDREIWLRSMYPDEHILSGRPAPSFLISVDRGHHQVASYAFVADEPPSDQAGEPMSRQQAEAVALADLGPQGRVMGESTVFTHRGRTQWEVSLDDDGTEVLYVIDAVSGEVICRNRSDAVTRPGRPQSEQDQPSGAVTWLPITLAAAAVLLIAGAVVLLRRRLS
jgi:uncharacterized protein YpmB